MTSHLVPEYQLSPTQPFDKILVDASRSLAHLRVFLFGYADRDSFGGRYSGARSTSHDSGPEQLSKQPSWLLLRSPLRSLCNALEAQSFLQDVMRKTKTGDV